MLALASVLSLVYIIKMPFGGRVTVFSMLPMLVIAYRHKTAWGLFAGFAYGIIQMLLGLENLSYGTSAAAVVAIIVLDYIVAFTAMGLGGLFRGVIRDSGVALSLGACVACVLRYICHVVSGCTVWAGVSIPTEAGLIYSLAYNAAYMIPETVATVVAAYFVGKIFTLSEENVRRIKLEKTSAVNLYSAIPVVMSVVLAFLMIFSMIQTEEGFDITALTSADVYSWVGVAVIIALGVFTSVIIKIAGGRTKTAE